MPKLKATTAPTLTVEATVAPALLEFQEVTAQIKALEARADELKAAVEIAYADAGRHEDLEDGVDIPTDDGTVSVTLVTGTTSSFDREGFLKAHKLTPAQWAKFVTTKSKAPYLRIGKPKAL